jgi:fatty acid CoA ligase FadD9
LFEEFALVQPTMLVSAPRLYDFLVSEHARERADGDCDDVDEKYKHIFGDRMQCICTGGAQTSQDTIDWLMKTFPSALVADGYGSSECGAIAINSQLVCAEHKLVPVEGYDFAAHIGELCVKTKTMANGYVGENVSLFDNEGFFHTGDVVELLLERKIRMVDRVKNCVKLAQGEMIALQKLETVYSLCPSIAAIAVLGDFTMTNVCAVIVAKSANFSEQQIQSELAVQAALHKLQGYEIPSPIIITTEPFSVANDCLTPR